MYDCSSWSSNGPFVPEKIEKSRYYKWKNNLRKYEKNLCDFAMH